jgi:putative transposase
MDLWAYQNTVWIDFSRLGIPTDNAHVESSNGAFRKESLNSHWFMTLNEAKEIIELWRRGHDESRPHRTLGERTPKEFTNGIMARRDSIEGQTAENSPLTWHWPKPEK